MRGNRLIVCVMLGLSYVRAGAVGPTGEIVRLKGHTDAVLSAVISADGRRVASGSNDHSAIIWDAESGRALLRLEGHAWGVTSVSFSADAGRVVTGSIDHTARVWDAKTGELLAILKGVHQKHVHGVSISPDGKRVLTASCDCSVVLWDVETERPLQVYQHRWEAHTVAFSPNGKTFLSGCRSGANGNNHEKNLRLYDALTGKVLDEFETEAEAVDHITYVDGGTRAIVLGEWQLAVLDIERRKLIPSAFGGIPMDTLGASSDGKRLLFGGPIEANLVELEPKPKVFEIFKSAAAERIRVTQVAPDGTWGLIAGGGKNEPWGIGQSQYEPAKDCDLRIVSLSGGFNPNVMAQGDPRLAETVGGLAGSADGSRLLSFYRDGSLVWWDGGSGRELSRIKGESSAIIAALSPDGARAAVLMKGGVVTGYDRDGIVGQVKDQSDNKVLAIAPGPDGGSVFVGGWRGEVAPKGVTLFEMEVHQYALNGGKELRTFKGPVGAVSGLAVSPDGRTLVALCSNRYGGESAVLAWEVASGRELWKWKPVAEVEKSMLGPVVIDAAGQAAAFVFGKKVVIVDLKNGKGVADLIGNTADVKKVAFDPDGKRIWTVARWDVRSWDRAKGAQMSELKVTMKSDQWAMRFASGHPLLIEAVEKRLIEHELDQ